MAKDPLEHWQSDRHLDVAGVWIDLGSGVEWRVAHAGGHNFEHARELSKIGKPGPDATAWEEFSYTASCLAGVYVKGWKGMVDQETGEPLEFNPGVCFQQLLDKPALVAFLMEVVLDRDRFRAAPRRNASGDRGVHGVESRNGGRGAAPPDGGGEARDVPVGAPSLSRFGMDAADVPDGAIGER